MRGAGACTAGVLLAILAAVTGCGGSLADSPTDADVGATRVYRCDDGFRFVTRAEPQRVWLFLPDTTTSLPQVPGASDLRYSDGRIVLRARGEEAVLELDGRTHSRCVNRPEEAVWEDARLRGIDVRGVGHDPVWSVEIDDGHSIVFVQETARFEFPWPTARDGASAAGSYHSESPGRRIRVNLENHVCRDSASAESFPLTVVVTLDERAYSGCGRRLTSS